MTSHIVCPSCKAVHKVTEERMLEAEDAWLRLPCCGALYQGPESQQTIWKNKERREAPERHAFCKEYVLRNAAREPVAECENARLWENALAVWRSRPEEL